MNTNDAVLPASPPPVLLVEDDRVAVETIRSCLAASGLVNPLVAIADGPDTLDYLYGRGRHAGRALPVLVILDVELPSIGGLELLRVVREISGLATVPVFMLSGSSDPGLIDRSMRLGATTYLVKPVGFEALADLVAGIDASWALVGPGRGSRHKRAVPLRPIAEPAHEEPQGAGPRVIDADSIEVHYQPIVDLVTRRVRSVEALARLRLPDGTLASPLQFIPQAEREGTIGDVGLAVLESACAQMADWHGRTPAPAWISLNVNLSPVQLHGDIAEDISGSLERSGVPASALVVEVTESGTAENEQISALHRIHDLGVRIAIDDFGTGYSSISHLDRLPVDIAKIDKSLIDGIGDDPGRWSVVHAIARLVDSLGLECVAEGIERSDQFTHMRAVGCDLGQGYYFSKPQPAEKAAAFMSDAALPIAL